MNDGDEHKIGITSGNVTEFRDGVKRAVCSCGWSGKQARTHQGAMAEAQKHIRDLIGGRRV